MSRRSRRATRRSLTALAVAVLPAACAGPGPGTARSAIAVEHWGAMRSVLREGRTEARVSLDDVVGRRTVGVGALEGLAAEVTIDHGTAHLAEVVDANAPEGLRVRSATGGERATLLVVAEVEAWTEIRLPAIDDLPALERVVRTRAAERGIDASRPFPFRVEGVAAALELHVLDRSCPIAHPAGPAPWRFHGEDQAVVLVGFHAEDAAGELTHHGQASHVHALVTGRDARAPEASASAAPAPSVSGHVDALRLAAGARLFLPRTTPP